MSDMLEALLRMQRKIEALPEPIAYIVLDHAWPPGPPEDSHDHGRRRYLRYSPAIMDELRRAVPIPKDGLWRGFASEPLLWWGVPVHRRDSLPENWPQA